MITVDNIKLRLFSEADMAESFVWANDRELARSINRKLPITLEEHKAWCAKVVNDKSQAVFAIMLLPEGKYIGNCGLKNIDNKNNKAELWIYIGIKDCQNRGFGKNTIKALLDYGFKKLDLNRIYLYVAEYNKVAINFYAGLGFKNEGIAREDIYFEGRYYNSVRMSMLHKEFKFTKNLNLIDKS